MQYQGAQGREVSLSMCKRASSYCDLKVDSLMSPRENFQRFSGVSSRSINRCACLAGETLSQNFKTRVLPARGEIGVFNRSYYEEVLTVRVHPEFLGSQYAGNPPPSPRAGKTLLVRHRKS